MLGWREWVSLPDLGIDHIKCKVDTGARTSALHAFEVETFLAHGAKRVRFRLHPLQQRSDIEVTCVADVIDERVVSDSGGHRERRIFICTTIRIGDRAWPIELTLGDRDTMRFRMLLGRTAIRDRYAVDPALSYVTGRPPRPQRTGNRR